MENDTETRNVRRIGPGAFDCEINHPVFGWVPFTAMESDPEPHGRAIYAALVMAEAATGPGV